VAFNIVDVREDLRAYIRDTTGVNTILGGALENTDDQLDSAINFGLMTFNLCAPLTNYTLINLPSNAYYFLINEAIIHILTSVGIFDSRNRLNYSNGGLTVADHDKAAPYQSWIQVLRQFFMQEKQYKIATNIMYGWGNIASEFKVGNWRIF
jgi:hypothetical protein